MMMMIIISGLFRDASQERTTPPVLSRCGFLVETPPSRETRRQALIRPGRIDRKIEFPLPDIKTKRHIFGIHTGRMSLAKDAGHSASFCRRSDETRATFFSSLGPRFERALEYAVFSLLH